MKSLKKIEHMHIYLNHKLWKQDENGKNGKIKVKYSTR